MNVEGGVWIAIFGSLAMAIAAACIFIFAVKKNLFENIEDAKYQIFWADHDDPPARPVEGDSAHVNKARR